MMTTDKRIVDELTPNLTNNALLRAYLDGAWRACMITKVGRIWVYVHYVGAARGMKILKANAHFKLLQEKMTARQRRRFQASIQRAGGTRSAI